MKGTRQMIDHSSFVIECRTECQAVFHTDGPRVHRRTSESAVLAESRAGVQPDNIWRPIRDGQRFLVLRPAETASGKPITIFVNWRAG